MAGAAIGPTTPISGTPGPVLTLVVVGAEELKYFSIFGFLVVQVVVEVDKDAPTTIGAELQAQPTQAAVEVVLDNPSGGGNGGSGVVIIRYKFQ